MTPLETTVVVVDFVAVNIVVNVVVVVIVVVVVVDIVVDVLNVLVVPLFVVNDHIEVNLVNLRLPKAKV